MSSQVIVQNETFTMTGDSIIEDKAAMQTRDLELVKSKIMAPYEFRMKYFGEDEETAKRILSEAHYG